jgi:hypothetical protein
VELELLHRLLLLIAASLLNGKLRVEEKQSKHTIKRAVITTEVSMRLDASRCESMRGLGDCQDFRRQLYSALEPLDRYFANFFW